MGEKRTRAKYTLEFKMEAVGYSQTNPSSVTNIYNAQSQPNTTIIAPRQVPQAPSVKGW